MMPSFNEAELCLRVSVTEGISGSDNDLSYTGYAIAWFM